MQKYGSYLKKPFACVFFLALMLISFTAFGATIRVPADYSTIQAGIDAATNGDTVLVANGTYTGAGNKNLDFKGKAITVRSENGPENTVIDCEGDGRGFYFHSGETQSSVLDGFTIINGRADSGGGIYCSSSPTIINCRIIGNEAENRGGGVYFTRNESANIINCIIAGNTAVYGGAIYCSYTRTQITNCTTIGNTGRGAIAIGSYFPDSIPTITNCILWDEPSEFYLFGDFAHNINYCDIKSREIEGGTIIHTDPRFVDVSDPDPVNWDLHLQSSSPCIDTGTSKGAPTHDIDGDSRPQGAGYDMGADEYDGNHRPDAHFSASPTSGAAPLTVNFTDQSTGQITSWSWDFGDGSTSTEQNPSHTYTDGGSYTVSLTVTGPGGSDTETKTGFISVITPKAMPWLILLLDDSDGKNPAIALSKTSVTFTAQQGSGNPTSQTVSVTNSGGGTLTGLGRSITYSGGQPTGWLSTSFNTTTAPATLTLQATTGSLAAGSYTATVAVTSSVAVNSPQNITVTFTVTGAPPAPPVLTGPSTANGGKFTITWTYDWPSPAGSDDHNEVQVAVSPNSGNFSLFNKYPQRATIFNLTLTYGSSFVGKTVYFRVRTKAQGKYSDWSNVIAVYVAS